jgi:hypothetical protein
MSDDKQDDLRSLDEANVKGRNEELHKIVEEARGLLEDLRQKHEEMSGLLTTLHQRHAEVDRRYAATDAGIVRPVEDRLIDFERAFATRFIAIEHRLGFAPPPGGDPDPVEVQRLAEGGPAAPSVPASVPSPAFAPEPLPSPPVSVSGDTNYDPPREVTSGVGGSGSTISGGDPMSSDHTGSGTPFSGTVSGTMSADE